MMVGLWSSALVQAVNNCAVGKHYSHREDEIRGQKDKVAVKVGKENTKGESLIFLCFVFSLPFLDRQEVKEESQHGSLVTSLQCLSDSNPLPLRESGSSCSHCLGEAGPGVRN